MLIIRDAQMEALSASMRAGFEERLGRHLAGRFPASAGTLAPPALSALVRAAVDRAKAWGIRTERDVAAFAELVVRLGAGFEEREDTRWAADLLSSPALVPAARLALVAARLPPEGNEAAAGGGR